MRTYKPLCQDGIALSPHYLQQQGRRPGFALQQFAPFAVAEAWGLLEARLDGESRLNHRLKMTVARVRFADGTPIDTSVADVLPSARDLALAPKDAAFARMMAARACQTYLPVAVPGTLRELDAVLTSQADR